MVYIRGSLGRIAEFRDLATRMIPMDNYIRWNGWFLILVVLFNVRPVVEKYCQDYKDKLKDDILSY